MIDLSKTIDLSTTYLGLKLKNPLVASSSPMCEDVATCAAWRTPAPRPWCCTRCSRSRSTMESDELDRFLARQLGALRRIDSSLPGSGRHGGHGPTLTWSTSQGARRPSRFR